MYNIYFTDLSEQLSADVKAANTVILFDAASSGTPVNNQYMAA